MGAAVYTPPPGKLRLPAARIVTSADGTYRRSPTGRLATYQHVRNAERELVDFVAWYVEKPTIWWMLYGDDCPLLGARQLAIACYFGDAIELHPTPQSWLLALGRGVVILRWDYLDLDLLFDGVGTVHCCSFDFEHRFRQALRAREPDIVVGASRMYTTMSESTTTTVGSVPVVGTTVGEVRHVA